MTTFLNSGAGGANNDPVTLANSAGGGDAFSHIIAGGATDAAAGNTSLIYSTTIADANYASALRFTLNSSNPGYFRWDDTQSGTRFVMERGFYVPASVASNYVVMDMRSSGGIMASIVIGTDKKLYITNPTTTVVAGSASPALTSGQWVRVKMAVTPAAAGSGTVELAVYAADGTTSLHSYTLTGATTTTTTPTQYRYGDSSAKTSFTYDYVGIPAAGPTASGWITPVAVPLTTPTVTVTAINDPTTVGGTNGSITISWGVISQADHYEARIAPGANATSGWTTDLAASSPKTFSGLSAGTYTLQVRARA